MSERKSEYSVAGCDLDISLVKSLLPGDKVILEMNGSCVPESEHPLASSSWTVIQNSSDLLRVTNRMGVDLDIDLPYENIVNLDPAVFRIFNSSLGTSGPIYVLLQFISYRATLNEIKERYTTSFDENVCLDALEDDIVKMGILENLHTYFNKFADPDFQARSIKRFALRSRVKEETIEVIVSGDYVQMMGIEDSVLVKLMKACAWLPCFIMARQDELATFV